MNPVGYAYLVSALNLAVLPPRRPAWIAGSVNRRVDSDDRVLFPIGVALVDTPLGHLEFALRHEGIDLPIIATALPLIGQDAIAKRFGESPNGEYIRRIAFLWEWLTGAPLDAGVRPTARYVDLFDPSRYVCARNPVRHPAYRVNDNALGNPRFCPVVQRVATPGEQWLPSVMAKVKGLAEDYQASGYYDRAIQYLYLSETRSSFAIERDPPQASREERFVRMLRAAGEAPQLREDELAEIQNAVVRDVFAREASYRTRQNWLENNAGRVTFLPHPTESLRETMAGWETFVNDSESGVDPLVKAACAAFGFVYLHPFMDGNGRLHRLIIHHVLAHSGLVPRDMIIPVSAVIMKHIPEYVDVLQAFSEPVTRLWDYRRLDDGPAIESGPGPEPYRYPSADREVAFLARMVQQAVEQEIPAELAWLRGYDAAAERVDAEFDLPQKDISRLIRMIHGNAGSLAARKRAQFDLIPDAVIARVEAIVRESFGMKADG